MAGVALLRSSTESGVATIEYTGPDACVLTVRGAVHDYRRAYEHDARAFEDAAALGFPAAGFQHVETGEQNMAEVQGDPR